MKEFLTDNPQVVVTLLIGFFTIIITFWYNHYNLKISHQKMEKELFTEFNSRYDNMNESLSLLKNDLSIDRLKEIDSKIGNKKLYDVLIDYFNLCSEQYYWKKNGRISEEIWNSWHAGMMYYYNNFPVVQELWKEETEDFGYKSYYLKNRDEFFK